MRLRVKKLCIALTALCSLSGCAAKDHPAVPQAPVVIKAALCPAPGAPALPPLDSLLPLDAPKNVRALLERDDLCRQYMNGLQATVRCYEAQTNGGATAPREAPQAAPGKSPAASLTKE